MLNVARQIFYGLFGFLMFTVSVPEWLTFE